MSSENFTFTVTDLARFLGKSPVTVRGWERKGLVSIPREGTDRKLNVQDVIDFAHKAHKLGRVSNERLDRITHIMCELILLEEENYEDRNRRKSRVRKK